ncbi:MAG: hypothetical protein NT154_35930 [Verrucomicrobia bacterium]|nr:hypothetical protein [Verrucomicrobiota bacterium]
MKQFDSKAAVRKGTAAQLSQILDLGERVHEWKEQDLPAMLQHQFAAPLDFDLRSQELAGGEARSREKTLTGAAGVRIETFGDLLTHPAPPLELLKLAKEFFKWRTQACKKDSPEWRIAYLFYLLTLLAAGKHASRLSSLSPRALLTGAKWALEQSWIDPQTRQFIVAACERLVKPASASSLARGE